MSFADTYLGKLRQKVGSDLIQVPGGRIIMEQSDGKILLQKRTDSYFAWRIYSLHI